MLLLLCLELQRQTHESYRLLLADLFQNVVTWIVHRTRSTMHERVDVLSTSYHQQAHAFAVFADVDLSQLHVIVGFGRRNSVAIPRFVIHTKHTMIDRNCL
jgi:hypothetical protein